MNSIGVKLFLGKFTDEEYSAAADWCNKNNAVILDDHAFDPVDPYYEIAPMSVLFPAEPEQVEEGQIEDVNG